ncbi:MAG TPA: GNAT family N-acetyltransferase [Chryseobacterium sp.]|nr:GNAT family N-acetyltransferase [Chryseobacterium sp.]
MFTIRQAKEADTELIFSLIRKLAVYEKMEDAVITSAEELREQLFVKENAQVLIAEEAGTAIGFALYFFNFSTFVGRAGLYLEDLYIEPEYRGKGYGKQLFVQLATLAKEKNCGRMEWSVLNWNTPAISFYKSLGAVPMDEWTVYRLDEKALQKLVK